MFFNYRVDPCALDAKGSGFYSSLYYERGCMLTPLV